MPEIFLKRPMYLSEQTVFLREHIKQSVKVVPSQEASRVTVESGSVTTPESLWVRSRLGVQGKGGFWAVCSW